MRLSELLNPQAITTRLRATSKREAIAELVDLLEAAHGIQSQGEVLMRVLNREATGSTGFMNGIAIPHGKARALNRMVAAVGIAPQGLAFDSMDGEPTYIVVLLAGPENIAPLQVKVLANISRVFKEESVRDELRRAPSAEAFLNSLRLAEAAQIPS